MPSLRDEHGMVFPEYAALIVALSIPVLIAIATLGLPLYSHLRIAQTLMSMPIP